MSIDTHVWTRPSVDPAQSARQYRQHRQAGVRVVLRGGFLASLVRFNALKRFAGALVRLLGAGDCRDGSAVEGSVAFPCGG
jgi:hypothetical protein